MLGWGCKVVQMKAVTYSGSLPSFFTEIRPELKERQPFEGVSCGAPGIENNSN
jgi:hypothetical protein